VLTRSNPSEVAQAKEVNNYQHKKYCIWVIRWGVLGAYSCSREAAQPRLKRKDSRTMKAKANLLRTLVVLPVGLAAVAVALFGVELRTAETQTTPFYYEVQDLGTLPGGDVYPPHSAAHGTNDSGHVVGVASYRVCPYGLYYCGYSVHAFLHEDGQMKDFGTLGGGYSEALAINNSGQVVGQSSTSSGEVRAFLYDSNNGMKDLGTLGGSGGVNPSSLLLPQIRRATPPLPPIS